MGIGGLFCFAFYTASWDSSQPVVLPDLDSRKAFAYTLDTTAAFCRFIHYLSEAILHSFSPERLQAISFIIIITIIISHFYPAIPLEPQILATRFIIKLRNIYDIVVTIRARSLSV